MSGTTMKFSSNSLLRQAEAHAVALQAMADGSFDRSRAIRLAPHRPGAPDPDPAPAREGARPESPIPSDPDISDLLGLDGEAFLDAAYSTLLGRPPDPPGLENYLKQLESGARTKIQVLWELANSKEGRRVGGSLRGLRTHYIVGRISALPILGYFVQWGLAFVRLPVTLHTIEQRRARLAHEVKLLSSELQIGLGRLSEARRQIGELADTIHQLSIDIREIRARNPEIPSETLQQIEVHFRGEEAGIERHLERYLPFLPDLHSLGNRAIDIGPGRGEWLRLIAGQGFDPIGIDNNPEVVRAARSRNQPVRLGDGVEYLQGLPRASCAVVSAFHVVEHLPFAVVLALIAEAARVLKAGGLLILETPNPECLYVGACSFWNDPSHRAPMPPMLLDHLVASSGFATEILRMNPSIQEADLPDDADAARTLQWLLGPQDYAIVATREPA